ncbi:hypothetical protein IEE_00229 [Bacillus cereus BAG5X1-1]|uniref:Glycosyltransferase 2-like domain-containing protein n=1 Tax=Bacillus cereus BAG5X1-1 TaxID=1053189 RepID=J8BNI1_BACCE|nr:glycosyltransferase family 2 protein [Bacillus cereus]EJQ53185.1 hypothetical protein IEE_00229 [Bacillus cereus BAG5X1-1]
MKQVSILIPTYNAGVEIRTLLNKLYNQKLPEGMGLEIIIVDSSSTDNTKDIIMNEFPKVKFTEIPNKHFDHGGTRNDLAKMASGDYLLYMTQDAIPVDNNLIISFMKELENEDNLICFARQIPKENANILEQFARGFNYPDEKIVKNLEQVGKLGIKTFFCSNVCCMYKRILFEDPYNGFPQKVILNEDLILASKVILEGKNVIYTSTAKVFHSHNYNLKQQFKRYFDIGMAFESTNYLLEHVSNEKEGARMIKKQANFLWKENKKMLVYATVENAVKLVAYKLGKVHKIIPVSLKRKLSAYMK